MRQYRQQQQFRQQRVLRQQQRLSQGIPQVPPPSKEVKRQNGSRSRSCSPKGKRKEIQGKKKNNVSSVLVDGKMNLLHAMYCEVRYFGLT
jgi:hypothetical protein